MALAGCAPDGAAFNPVGFLSTKRVSDRVSVTAARVAIAGPQGYCIDDDGTRDGSGEAFVVLGSCASISRSARQPAPAEPALLTASVSSGEPVSIERAVGALPSFFRSETGRRALSRAGDPATVEIIDTTVDGEMFVLRVRDRSPNLIGAVEDTYLRGLFDIDGALVTISVIGLRDRPISDAGARQTLLAFAREIRAANAGPGPVQVAAAPAQANPLAAIFRRRAE